MTTTTKPRKATTKPRTAAAKRPTVKVLPEQVTDFLGNLVHEPKREFATAQAQHMFLGAKAPKRTGAAFEDKAIRRLERIQATIKAAA